MAKKKRRYGTKDITPKGGYYFGCLKCAGNYRHQSRMLKDSFGMIMCPKCGGQKFIMRKK